jgi:chromosome segregation ATPase
MKILSALFVICVVSIATIAGCGVRAEVARDNVMRRIDSMLGTMEVKRKEIDASVDKLHDAIAQLRKAKIKAHVQRDQLRRKHSSLLTKVEGFDDTLRGIREQLADGESVRVDGTTHQATEVTLTATRIMREREALVSQSTGYQIAIDRLGKVISTLEGRQSDYEIRLDEIKHQLSVIDSNRVALTAMQEAAAIMDGHDASFAKGVLSLEEKVNDLFVDVEAGLMEEDYRWESEGLVSAEQLAAATISADELSRQIDSIVAAGK